MKLNLLKASFDLITLGQSYNYFVDLVKRGNNMQKKAKRKDMSASERKKGRNDHVQVRLWVVYSLPVRTKTAIFNYIHAP